MRFAIKHAIATAITIVTTVGLLTIAYFGLLTMVAVRGGEMGSPVVLPVTIVVLVPGLTLAALFVFLPSTALTEWLFRKSVWPRIAQIPVVTGVAAVAVLLAVMATVWMQGASPERGARASANIFTFLMIPLGVYWWSLQATAC